MTLAGQHDNACFFRREAIRNYQVLLDENPDTYRPGLAKLTKSLAVTLANLNLWEEANIAFVEAADLYRNLIVHDAKASVDAYRAELGSLLYNHGVAQGELGLSEGACNALADSAKIRRDLCAQDTGEHIQGLFRSLDVLGDKLADIGRLEEARVTYEEALALCRRGVVLDNDQRGLNLALVLSRLGLVFCRLMQWEDAKSTIADIRETNINSWGLREARSTGRPKQMILAQGAVGSVIPSKLPELNSSGSV